ncbi:MAG: hypothetical protein H0W62_13405 [Chitinophagales bacterium]|nr:hypothetical protein [Chitinophagales bacterium]
MIHNSLKKVSYGLAAFCFTLGVNNFVFAQQTSPTTQPSTPTTQPTTPTTQPNTPVTDPDVQKNNMDNGNKIMDKDNKGMDENMNKNGMKDSWEDFRSDVKAKYQKVMDEVQAVKEQAKEKKFDASPDFKQALDRFESRAKEFGRRMRDADEVSADKRTSFRKEMDEDLARLNAERDKLKAAYQKQMDK